MPKRLSKKDSASDPNRSAFRVVQATINSDEREEKKRRPNVVPLTRPKNAAAVALGRRGGKASAAVRMERIPEEKRRAIASHAARQRWEKQRGDGYKP